MGDEVEISNNTIGGDAVGRDKITNVTEFNSTFRGSDYLEQLYKRLAGEEKSDEEKKFIEDLEYYVNRSSEDVLGLEKKLENGNRQDTVLVAKELKERYHKKLIRTAQFSEAAQRINLHLLASVRTTFLTEIYPKILEKVAPSLVDGLINERIIKPLLVELGENRLDFNNDHILGMIYFLTGNCHIKWNR